MIIKLFCFDGQLEISDEQVATLEIANRDCFRRIIKELKGLTENEIHEIIISLDNELVEPKDIETIFDTYSVKVNDKNYLTKLYKSIENYFNKLDDNLFSLNELSAHITLNFNNLIFGYPLDLVSKTQLGIKDYLKFLDVKLSADDESFQDNVNQLISANRMLGFAKVFVFVNFKSMMSQQEIQNIINIAVRARCPLVLLENTFDERVFKDEKKLSVDNDLYCTVK